MKFSLVAIAATLAVVNAVDCDLSKITPLLSNPNVATCTADSGFVLTTLTAPTAEMLPKICASAGCMKVLSAVKELALGDCMVRTLSIEKDLVDPITKACSGSSSTTPSAGSSAGSKASAATVTTPAPATTTAAPKSASGSGSGVSSNTVKTPSATSAPSPSPTKSAASAVTVAASAAVVAVAAAFM